MNQFSSTDALDFQRGVWASRMARLRAKGLAAKAASAGAGAKGLRYTVEGVDGLRDLIDGSLI